MCTYLHPCSKIPDFPLVPVFCGYDFFPRHDHDHLEIYKFLSKFLGGRWPPKDRKPLKVLVLGLKMANNLKKADFWDLDPILKGEDEFFRTWCQYKKCIHWSKLALCVFSAKSNHKNPIFSPFPVTGSRS